MPRLIAGSKVWISLVGLTAIYVLTVAIPSHRFVWYDELLTFDIAGARSIHQIWDLTARFDLNLPAFYLLSRLSMSLVGRSAIGLRLPSMIEFYVGSLLLFFYCRRKTGDSFAAFGVLILWSSGAFYYATEARSYALLLMCFCGLLLCWDNAHVAGSRRLALAGVAFSGTGMLLAHGFAPFSLLPFLAAQAVRSIRHRNLDWPVWGALLIPFVALLSYIPLFHFYGKLLYPVPFQASFATAVSFYTRSLDSVCRIVLLALLGALMVPALTSEPKPFERRFRIEDLVLFAVLLLNPILLNLELMRGSGAFWDRYSITTQVFIYAGIAMLLGVRLHRNPLAGYIPLMIVALGLLHRDLYGYRMNPPRNANILEQVRPDLPIVAAGGLTFFEMNHHEDSTLLSRLYYLKDRGSSIQYAHTNFFEDFDDFDAMREFFPITAHVEPYGEFIRAHREFLVLGSYNAYEWLLPKLQDDHAQITLIKNYSSLIPYADVSLYFVKF